MAEEVGAVQAKRMVFLGLRDEPYRRFATARCRFDDGGARRSTLGFTVETAREFRPADAEKDSVITEISAGLMEFLLETLCPAEVIQALLDAIFPLQAMHRCRDRHMLTRAAGARHE